MVLLTWGDTSLTSTLKWAGGKAGVGGGEVRQK